MRELTLAARGKPVCRIHEASWREICNGLALVDDKFMRGYTNELHVPRRRFTSGWRRSASQVQVEAATAAAAVAQGTSRENGTDSLKFRSLLFSRYLISFGSDDNAFFASTYVTLINRLILSSRQFLTLGDLVKYNRSVLLSFFRR